MAAAWESEDSLAAEVPQYDTKNQGETASEIASPLESQTTGERPQPFDPFEQDDRFAELPNDPFDEPISEPVNDLVPENGGEPEVDLDKVEEALDNELERRQQNSVQDTSEDSESDIDTHDEDKPKTDLDMDSVRPEAEDTTQPGTTAPDRGVSDFELKVPSTKSPESIRPNNFRPTKQFAEELEESQKSCEEELAAVKADKISSVDLSIRVEGKAGEDFPYECTLGGETLQPRVWPEITYTWKASALCHKPLYFEQDQLERHGHDWGPYLQPVMSGVHFFSSIPILPYKMGIESPNECVYALGHYRPGSCAPYMIEATPFTWRAAAYQTGVLTGMTFAFP